MYRRGMRKLIFTAYLVVFHATAAFAQAATSTATASSSQPVWLTLVLGLAPYLISGAVGLVLASHLGAWLRSDAAKRKGGIIAAIEGVAAVGVDDVQALVKSDGATIQDLLDPTKRAAAEAKLAADGIATAKASASAAVDAAIKRDL